MANSLEAARVSLGAAQSLASATLTAIEFDTEEFDTDGLWTVSSPTRLTITLDGVYVISGRVLFAPAGGNRIVQIDANGTTTLTKNQVPGVSSATWSLPVATVAELSASDFVELMAQQNSAGSLDANQANFEITRVG